MDYANNLISMMAFTNWLAEALERFSPADPFYTERLLAFKKLNHPTFMASQKENYRALREMVQLLMRQAYQPNLPTEPFLTQRVKMDGYRHAAQTTTLTFVNGVWSSAQSSWDPAGQAIQLHRLADLPPVVQKEVLKSYRADLASSDDLFALLNSLLSPETYLLEIQPHVEEMITIQHIITDGVAHLVPQLMVKIDQASQVTIVENWYTTNSTLQPFVNNVTHIALAEAARLAYHTLHTEYPSCYQVNTLYCHQKEHSHFTHHTFSFGSTRLHMHLTARLDGNHASAMLYGLCSMGGREKVDHRIQVIHSCPHGFSKQHYKSILGGQSTAAFSGKIYLTPAAQQTNAYQTSNALILSNEAHYYAKPQLEIYADDVKCSHGATTGALDEAQLFYLQTRGIPLPLAKRLLLEAFGSPIIDAVSVAPLQDYLWDKLVAKLIEL